MSTILCSGGFLAAVAYGAASLRPDLIGVITTSTLAGAAFALVHSSLAASASDVVPGQRAVVMSLFVASVFAGSSLVTATLAPLAASHQHDRVFGAATVVALMLASASLPLRRSYEQSEASGHQAR